MSTENLRTNDLLLAFFSSFPSNEHSENCAISYTTRLLSWEFGDCAIVVALLLACFRTLAVSLNSLDIESPFV